MVKTRGGLFHVIIIQKGNNRHLSKNSLLIIYRNGEKWYDIAYMAVIIYELTDQGILLQGSI